MDFLKGTNTFYLYLKKKNFRDPNIRRKHALQETVLENSLSLGRAFPVSSMVQIFENETYSIEDILRDNRKVDFESYLRKGTSKSRNLDQVARAEASLEELLGRVVPVHEVHRGNGIQQLLRVSNGPFVRLIPA